MKGGCQEKTSPVPPAAKMILGSQPLKLHFGLAVILRQTDGPEFGVCSPILRWSEEFSAENTVLLSKSEFRSHIAELLTTLPETSSSFAVGQRMPTMVLLEPHGLQLYLVSARGHRVYMGT
jgi:hypothetical protein